MPTLIFTQISNLLLKTLKRTLKTLLWLSKRMKNKQKWSTQVKMFNLKNYKRFNMKFILKLIENFAFPVQGDFFPMKLWKNFLVMQTVLIPIAAHFDK